MQTEAVFENIAERIQQEINQAQKSIFIAVAWFTNKKLFNTLLNKSKNGCTVSLIISNDSINQNSDVNFDQLLSNKSRVYKIGNGDTELMHNKFCVIDYTTVITGSYNWSYKAENNFENIVITYEDLSLAEQFVKQFQQIKQLYYPKESIPENDFPLDKIIKRLEIIKNYIVLEDIDDVNAAIQKINQYDFNNEIETIISSIKQKEYSVAIALIQQFINKNQKLTLWNDPEIAGIRLEIKLLESEINAFDNEKIELEKVLSDFQYRHTLELGDLILEVLKLRKVKYKNHKKEAEAEKDYTDYKEQFENDKDKHQFELTDEQKAELKKNFRKATTLCHPDKVSEEHKASAQQQFIELKKAYDEHDIEKVNQILKELQTNPTFSSPADTITEKEKLKTTLEKLKRKLQELEKQIINLKESETFTTINTIQNWDNYFAETKIQLKEELQNLTVELEN